MKCSQTYRLMSDYVDGVLTDSKANKLELHIQNCNKCANLFVEMKSLVTEAGNLREFQPSEDVWLSIRHHMESKDRKARSRQYEKRNIFSFFRYPQGIAIASTALLAIMIFTFLFYNRMPIFGTESRNSQKYALHHFEKAEKHYQLAIDALVRAMPDYKKKLPPDLAAVLKKNLSIIDDSIRICQAAIREHPGDKAANALLMACYRKKIQLLNEIRDLAMQAG